VTQHGPVAAAAAARAAPASAAARASSSIDPLRHALASYYSNRSAVRSWALWTTRGACTCSPRRPPLPHRYASPSRSSWALVTTRALRWPSGQSGVKLTYVPHKAPHEAPQRCADDR
jgi:hypothetical protein